MEGATSKILITQHRVSCRKGTDQHYKLLPDLAVYAESFAANSERDSA